MKTKINLSKRDYTVIIITLAAGLLFGWLIFHHSKSEDTNAQTLKINAEQVHEEATIWTCSMHPQIRMEHPGKCPICGMDLIPLKDDQDGGDAISPDEIQMTDAAMKIADIQTMVVKKGYPEKNVYLLGKVNPDERNMAELTARFGGRIEKLFVNFTGQNVKKGEKLATIYSPALMTAQKELLEAMEYKKSNPDLYKATRNKLKLWDLTDAQIDDIEKQGTPLNYFDVLSPIEGTVTRRNVSLGDYVKEGSTLFQVIDLTRIWIMFDAYESDLPWIKLGDKVTFTIQSLPGKNFSGRISFIDPTIDPKTRVAHVRVEAQNPGLLLKPEMFANGTVTSTIAGNNKDILVPKTALLWTGKRSVVYVKDPNHEQPVFGYREVTMGPTSGDFYVIKSGLKEGEEIAVNGVFKIDAAAQLAGKPSMMNRDGGDSGAGSMPGMDMGSGNNSKNKKEQALNESSSKSVETNPTFKAQLTKVYENYVDMKNAFVATDAQKVSQEAQKVESAIQSVNMELLKGDAHIAWMNQLKTLNSETKIIAASSDIEAQRQAFSKFNEAFYKSLKMFGLENDTAYYQFCPMFNNGAYWISETEKIRNPYYGEKMMDCGETKERLE